MTNKELELRVIKLEASLLQKEISEGLTAKQQPKEEFEVGVWYIHKDIRFSYNNLFFVTGKKKDRYNYYGFLSNDWVDKEYCVDSYLEEDMRKATHKEIETALIKEAKKRGFKEGVRFKCLSNINTTETFKGNFRYENGTTLTCDSSGSTFNYGCIFEDGKWSEIIENSFEIAGHKVEIDGDTVKIGYQRLDKIRLQNLFDACIHCGIDYFHHNEDVKINVDELGLLIDYINARNI